MGLSYELKGDCLYIEIDKVTVFAKLGYQLNFAAKGLLINIAWQPFIVIIRVFYLFNNKTFRHISIEFENRSIFVLNDSFAI